MSERIEAFLSIELDPSASVPLKQQLYGTIVGAMRAGKLRAGTRLPSSRVLAAQLSVSRATVLEVFDLLLADGLTTAQVGSGTFVTGSLARVENAPAPTASVERLSQRGNRAVELDPELRHQRLDRGIFRVPSISVDEFPTELWARSMRTVLRTSARDVLDYGAASGYPPLRRAIAHRLAITRGLRCRPEQLFIVDSTRHALDLIAQMLIDEGACVWVEDPGYAVTTNAFAAAGARVTHVPVDDCGIDVSVGIAGGTKPSVICVAPSHSFPAGVTLSLDRRKQVLDHAKASSAWIVEDDFESEFRYAGVMPESIHSLDPDGRVFYVGTFSATMYSSMRMGYVVVPEALVDAFAAARRVGARGPNALDQASMALFIENGDFTRHVNRVRTIYAERRAVLLEELKRYLEGAIAPNRSEYGTYLRGDLPAECNDVRFSRRFAGRGIALRAVSPHAVKARDWNAVLLGFAAFTPGEIREGVATLTRTLEQIDKKPA